MGIRTDIAWADESFNGWWGCVEVSPGCDNCYAKTLSERWNRATWGDPKFNERWITSNANWRQPRVWNARVAAGDTTWTDTWREPVRPDTKRRLVFSNSMSDVFEQAAQLNDVRARLWTLIEETPYLDWLLLTKRPQNIRRMLPSPWINRPLKNVWLGTSAENQEWADRRIPRLLDVPAYRRFVSAEPLLGKIDFGLHFKDCPDWIITGGESGSRHRYLDMAWIRDIDWQCKTFGVAHFFKQVGGSTHAEGGCLLDGMEVKDFPTTDAPEPLLKVA